MKLILLAILAVVLAANNPSENDFEQHVGDKIARNEIAKKLGISSGTSKTNLMKAKAKMKELLSKEYGL